MEVQADPGEANFHLYVAQMADLTPWLGVPYRERGSGAGFNRAQALGAAIGEVVERYASAMAVFEAEMVEATSSDLGQKAVDLSAFAAYAPEQYAPGFPFRAPDSTVPFRWMVALSLTEKAPRFVPAQCVLQPYNPGLGETLLCEHNSTGLAAARNWEQAVLSGLLEVIERDAFMIHWLAQIPAPRLNWERDPELAVKVRARDGRD